jgi:aryl-alcohol dehydrogenase-like predicted oxidoreductase
MPKPVIAQHLYNVLIRELDVEWFSFARKYGIETTIYNPLAGGLLTGKHSRDGSTQKGSRFDKNKLYQGRYFTAAMFDRVDQLTAVAKESGLSLLELAYAWAAGAKGVDSIILGPASVEQLEQGVAACKLQLSPETRATIDALHRDWSGTDTHYVR